MTDVRVVPLEAVTEGAILDLLRKSLGAEHLRTPEFWRWKHHRNPFGESPGCVAIDARGHPVALRVFLRWQLHGPRGTLRAARAVDTATHPEWRRQGLFRKLTTAALQQLADDGVELVFNTPNPRSLQGYLSMGWQSVGRLPLAIGVRHPVRLMRHRLFRTGEETVFPKGLRPCEELLGHPAVVDWLQGPGSVKRRWSTLRSAQYYRWRYVDIPSFDYGALLVGSGSAWVMGIFRLRRRSGALELSLSEVLSNDHERPGVLERDLCRQAVVATGADYVVAMADSTRGADLSARPGLPPLRLRGPTLVARLLASSSSVRTVLRMSNWDLSIGDMELF